MKSAPWLVVTVVTVASLPLTAQQANANGQAGVSANATAAGAQSGGSMSGGSINTSASGSLSPDQAGSANGSASVSGPSGTSMDSDGSANAAAYHTGASASGAADGTAEMRPVKGELEGKLDAKSARPGDQVVVRTTEKMKTADGTEIPKGSLIVGHLTEVQAHEKERPVSHMGIAFDRAALKDGRNIPIHSSIESVSVPASAMAAAGGDDMAGGMNGGMAGGAMAGGSASGGRAMEGGSAGGGLIGSGGGLVGGAATTVSSAGSRVGSDVGSAAGNATRELGGDLNGVAAGTSSLSAHATGVPGVMLRDDVTGSASGMLSATNKNVHLDSGTQLVLGVAAAGKE